MKHPIYIICHLCFFNQVQMAYILLYGRFYGPQKNTMRWLSTAQWYDCRGYRTVNDTTVDEIWKLSIMQRG